MTKEYTGQGFPILVIALNYFPALYLAALASILFGFQMSSGAAIGIILFWVYLLPPLVCRIVLLTWREPRSHAPPNTSDFKKWWFLTQLQTFFNRFPALEEMLKIIPSFYSLWLCLWGSQVSTLVLWSPGVRVTDRYLLEIEKFAVLGWGAKLSPHTVALSQSGQSELTLGKITIGKGAIIGGHATLGPGSHVYPGESFPATRVLGPFRSFQNGRRKSQHGVEESQEPKTRKET